jgi:hypothetical protein
MREQQILVALSLCCIILFALVGCVRGKQALSWGVERIRPYCLWDNDNWNMTDPWDVDSGANAGQTVNITVVDSGVDYYTDGQEIHYHPDLAANIAGGMGFIDNNGHPYTYYDYHDDDGHGTQIIGIIAAVVNGLGANQSGIVGAAPETRIWALKAYGNLPFAVAAAINYSVDHLHAQIINLSMGKDVSYPVVETACDYAYAQGALIFASSGNEGVGMVDYPALYANVSAVGSIDKNDTRADFSSYGPKLDFVTPGVDIPTTTIGQSYTNVTHTSYSTPFACAIAALIWNSKLDPNFDFNDNDAWDNNEVWTKMQNTTLDLYPPGNDSYTGWGLPNAWLANQRPVGDINLDLYTDGSDLIIAARAWGTVPGDLKWDPRADINIDKRVDGGDMIIIARHFGEGDP